MQIRDDDWQLPAELVGNGQLFLLRVRGDSMIDAAILDGDWVAVRQQKTAENGEIVVAMIDGEATVKTLRRTDSRVWLMPQNPVYDPIPAEKASFSAKWSQCCAASDRCRSPWSCLGRGQTVSGEQGDELVKEPPDGRGRERPRRRRRCGWHRSFGRGASLCRAEALAHDTDGIHPDEVLGFALYPGLKADVADRRTLGLGIHLMRRAPH